MNRFTRGRRRFSASRWAVERERCRVADPVQPPAGGDAVPIGEAVDSVLRGLRMEERDWQSGLIDAWVEVAGRSVAKHARPGKMAGTILTVFVDSSAWLAEIARTHRAALLQALQRRFGADRITGLRLMPDPDGRQPRPPPTSGA
jgi:hypothetical protein